MSIIDFASRIIRPIFALYYKHLEIGEVLSLVSITVLSRFIFSHYILKIILYRHHVVSLIIFLIGYFFKAIFAYIAGDIQIERWPFLLFVIIQFILVGLEDVLNKLLLTEKYMLPHVLMAIVLAIIIKFSGFEFTFISNYNIILLFSLLIVLFFF